jgi:tetratricopeptide (TPR) repeat protein
MKRNRERRVVILAGAMLACACSQQTPAPTASAPAAPPPAAAAAAAAPMSAHAPAPGPTLADWARGAQLFDNLGSYARKVTTQSPQAQAFFDQGLRLIYAFNHDEATRAFAKAVEFDPACAPCYWGAAEALGPNYNMPAMTERWAVLWRSVEAARRNAANATPIEQALVAALGKRYQGSEPVPAEKMQPFNDAYAGAMRDVANQFPDDDDVQVFFAEALMTANPWKLWSIDGKASPGTAEIVATLERVLSRNPQHPGANHYYVHAVEASPHPEQGVAAAERLPGLLPGAGHIVHMPAHIFQRLGRYADAGAANRAAIKVDLDYLDQAKPPAWTYYGGMYLGHNYQFLGYAAAMQGRSTEALQATREMRAHIPDAVLHMGMGLDWYAAEPYFAMERFGRWTELLAEAEPDPALFGLSAAHRYGRAVALAATGKVDEAKAEKAKLDAIDAATPADAPAGLNAAKDMIAVALLTASARIEIAQAQHEAAIATLRDAVAKEDRLAYDEPADWFVPVRHLLGAELLAAGKAVEAEAVYRDDLQRHPDNGWALFGLGKALRAQERNEEAAAVETRFSAAWKDADITLTASAF